MFLDFFLAVKTWPPNLGFLDLKGLSANDQLIAYHVGVPGLFAGVLLLPRVRMKT